jgi:hypothetical protein
MDRRTFLKLPIFAAIIPHIGLTKHRGNMQSNQIRELIIRPVIDELNLLPTKYRRAEENLLLGTAAVESALGKYLRQSNGGPDIGMYQMEPTTYDDIWSNFLNSKANWLLRKKVICHSCRSFLEFPYYPDCDEVIGNLYFATAIARVHYYRAPEAIPDADDIEGMARYWKRYYNTVHGKGTEKAFIDRYNQLVI